MVNPKYRIGRNTEDKRVKPCTPGSDRECWSVKGFQPVTQFSKRTRVEIVQTLQRFSPGKVTIGIELVAAHQGKAQRWCFRADCLANPETSTLWIDPVPRGALVMMFDLLLHLQFPLAKAPSWCISLPTVISCTCWYASTLAIQTRGAEGS